MESTALFGFIGVVLGSLTTSALTVYRERFTAQRELEDREMRYERERKAERDRFQRACILELQTAVADLVHSVHAELDRILANTPDLTEWPAREWETPTAVGWSEALLRLQTHRARVFSHDLRALAVQIQQVGGDCVWAPSHARAKELSEQLEPLHVRFNDAVTAALPPLY